MGEYTWRRKLIFIFLLALGSALPAADFHPFPIPLDMDGSADPPADKVHFDLFLTPEETEVLITVRPFIAYGTDNQKKEQVKAAKDAGEKYADKDGLLRVEVPVKVAAGRDSTLIAKVEALIPYAAFQIEDGTHDLYYEITAEKEVDGKKVNLFTTRTRVTTLVVGKGTRTTLVLPNKPATYVEEKTEVTGYRIIPGKDEPEKFTTEVGKYNLKAAAAPGAEVPVSIDRRFERDQATTAAVSSVAKFKPENKRTIYFATNRNRVANASPDKAFGTKLGPLTYGTSVVNVPVTKHTLGSLETASWWESDPKNVFLVDRVSRPISAQEFFSGLSKEDVILYVHGFNNSFADALFRAAQFQHDTMFPGKVAAFTWPSQGSFASYGTDGAMADASEDAMIAVLKNLVAGPDNKTARKGKVHAIAHSMGSRILLRALNRLAKDKFFPADSKPFANIFFAAPDVDIGEFTSNVQRALRIAENVTYYYSTFDTALGVSATRNGIDRAGLHPFFSDGMHTICVDNANSRLNNYGHTYFAAGDRVILDLNLAIVGNVPPNGRRPPLNPPGELPHFAGYDHYTFRPQ